jgi:hypothetical protein
MQNWRWSDDKALSAAASLLFSLSLLSLLSLSVLPSLFRPVSSTEYAFAVAFLRAPSGEEAHRSDLTIGKRYVLHRGRSCRNWSILYSFPRALFLLHSFGVLVLVFAVRFFGRGLLLDCAARVCF